MEIPRKCTVLAADAEPLALRGLVETIREIPGFEVCAVAETIPQARERCALHAPDILVLDPAQGDGFALIKDLPLWSECTHTVVLTRLADAGSVQRAFQAGAFGYVMRSDPVSSLEFAILSALVGDRYLGLGAQRAVLGAMARGTMHVEQGDLAKLSPRELDVFHRIGVGLSSKVIAQELGMSVKTVETHRQRMKEKLRLRTGADLNHVAFLHQQQAVAA